VIGIFPPCFFKSYYNTISFGIFKGIIFFRDNPIKIGQLDNEAATHMIYVRNPILADLVQCRNRTGDDADATIKTIHNNREFFEKILIFFKLSIA